MLTARFVVAAVAVVLLGLGGSIAGAYFLALSALEGSQHDLCPIIRLATAHPVPRPADPSSNPSREQNYRFYEAFVAAGRKYGC